MTMPYQLWRCHTQALETFDAFSSLGFKLIFFLFWMSCFCFFWNCSPLQRSPGCLTSPSFFLSKRENRCLRRLEMHSEPLEKNVQNGQNCRAHSQKKLCLDFPEKKILQYITACLVSSTQFKNILFDGINHALAFGLGDDKPQIIHLECIINRSFFSLLKWNNRNQCFA